jgi:hypothetical protein
MHSGEWMKLVRCPVCEGDLIYPVSCAALGRRSVIRRRCPECEHRDIVETTSVAGAIWLRRENRIAERLSALADLLADGWTVELDEQRAQD